MEKQPIISCSNINGQIVYTISSGFGIKKILFLLNTNDSDGPLNIWYVTPNLIDQKVVVRLQDAPKEQDPSKSVRLNVFLMLIYLFASSDDIKKSTLLTLCRLIMPFGYCHEGCCLYYLSRTLRLFIMKMELTYDFLRNVHGIANKYLGINYEQYIKIGMKKFFVIPKFRNLNYIKCYLKDLCLKTFHGFFSDASSPSQMLALITREDSCARLDSLVSRYRPEQNKNDVLQQWTKFTRKSRVDAAIHIYFKKFSESVQRVTKKFLASRVDSITRYKLLQVYRALIPKNTARYSRTDGIIIAILQQVEKN